MSDRVTVTAPATTANMGPGFDCLAMALDIWSTIDVEVGSSGFEVLGVGVESLPHGSSSLVKRGFRLPFREAGRPVPEVRITYRNKIPVSRGLGSSSAAVVGGLLAGNEISGAYLDNESLLKLAFEQEGHPDNAAAALLGGCQIVAQDEQRLITASVPVPNELSAVLFIPDVAMPTNEARALLSGTVSRQDAVYNMSRVGLLVRALATGDFKHLAVATADRLHQPARQSVFPAMKNIFRAALSAGALGVFLSGAGSSVLALTRGKEVTIGYEMADAAAKSDVSGDIKITRPTSKGAHLVPNS